MYAIWESPFCIEYILLERDTYLIMYVKLTLLTYLCFAGDISHPISIIIINRIFNVDSFPK